jgi:ADP-ribosylation factor protein 1
VWDVGGQDKIRRLWKFCKSPSPNLKKPATLLFVNTVPTDYQGTKALIFVVDSNDTDRVSLAAEQLHAILNDEEMRNVVLLVFANKSDLPHALSTSELTDRLGLYRLRDKKWYVQVRVLFLV